MKVRAIQQLEAQITPQEHKRLFLEYIYRHFDWHNDYFLDLDEKTKNWIVCKKELVQTSHAWEDRVKVREASEQDLLVVQIVAKTHQIQ
jgi:hypothetical protein